MFAITIKDLEMRLSNSNLLLEKNPIWFKLFTHKKGLVSKQLMSNITNTKSLLHREIYLSGKNIGQNLLFASKLNCHNVLEICTHADSWRG